MARKGHRTEIIVATIGLIGVLGAAIIGNWDKIFRHTASEPGPSVKPAPLALPSPSEKGNVGLEGHREKPPSPDKDASDLTISSLAAPDRVLTLPGHPIKRDPASAPIFTGGFEVSFTLTHNKRGKHPIVINQMRLNVEKFVAGPIPEYEYQVAGDEIIGAGTKPDQFHVSVTGYQVGRATWDLGGEKYAVAKSRNFFDVPNPDLPTLRPESDDLKAIKGRVVIKKAGYYELSFQFNYYVRGQDRGKKTEKVRVYSQE